MMQVWICVFGHSEGRAANGSCKVCRRIKAKQAYKQNPDAIKRTATEWNKTNAERRREIQRKSYDKNREKIRARQKEVRDANPAAELARCRKRQAAKLKRTPTWADLKAIKNIYIRAAEITDTTGIPHHVDHEIPLRGKNVSGLHVENNLKIIPAVANLRKGRMFQVDA